MATNNSINESQTGVVCYAGSGTYYGRTITAGTGISVADGDGISGNPTISATGGSAADAYPCVTKTGQYYFPDHLSDGVNTTLYKDYIFCIPWYFPQSFSYDQIVYKHSSTNTTTVRIGIYDSSNGKPTSLLINCGTISLTSNAIYTLSNSNTITAGLRYLGLQYSANEYTVTWFIDRGFLPGVVSVGGGTFEPYPGMPYYSQAYGSGFADLTGATPYAFYPRYFPIVGLRAS